MRAQQSEICADLFRRWPVAVIRMLPPRIGRIGNAGELAVEIGAGILPLEQAP